MRQKTIYLIHKLTGGAIFPLFLGGGISGFRVGSMGDKMRYASHEINIPISALIASEPVVFNFSLW